MKLSEVMHTRHLSPCLALVGAPQKLAVIILLIAVGIVSMLYKPELSIILVP